MLPWGTPYLISRGSERPVFIRTAWYLFDKQLLNHRMAEDDKPISCNFLSRILKKCMSINLLAVTFSCCQRLTGVSFAWAQSRAQGPSKSSHESLLAGQMQRCSCVYLTLQDKFYYRSRRTTTANFTRRPNCNGDSFSVLCRDYHDRLHDLIGLHITLRQRTKLQRYSQIRTSHP